MLVTKESMPENPAFRRLLAASSVSLLGSRVTIIAFPLLVLRLTGSSFMTGCAVFAANAPIIFAYLPAGVLVDRWNPRRVMLLAECGRAVAVGSVAIMLVAQTPVVGVLMAAAVLEGVLAVFSQLAERRYVNSIVQDDLLPRALVQTEARNHVIIVIGRPLGVLLFTIGPIFPFLADVATFCFSVLMLVGIKHREWAVEAAEASAKATLRTGLTAGLRWIHLNNFARKATISFSIGTLAFQALLIVFLTEAHAQQLPAFAVGVVLAASGIGGFLGSLAANRLFLDIRRRGGRYSWIKIQSGIWLAGFTILIFPVGRQFVSMAIIMILLGLTGAIGNVQLDTHIMTNPNRELTARIYSVVRLMAFTAAAVGPLLGGVLSQEFGTQRAMFYLCALILVAFLLSLSTPAPVPYRAGRDVRVTPSNQEPASA
jgi:MFS family permease